MNETDHEVVAAAFGYLHYHTLDGNSTWGNAVFLRHPDMLGPGKDLYTIYSHLAEFSHDVEDAILDADNNPP
ncbi:MAG: hypothetical protein KIS87_04780 [Phycisphaeraceae bacterium]|nr:hypothetical protein [Phycisphaeraceae bacterium]